MNRRLLASMLVGLGLTWGAYALAPAFGDDKADKQTKAGSSEKAGDADQDPAKRIDKAIQSYESRAEQELDQTRKEIVRLRKELTELVELQNDMAISLAELQAEQRIQAADDAASAGGNGRADSESSNNDKERQRLRDLELNRELRQVQDSLRSVVQQKRNETDQLVAQLRNIRAQQRQVAAEREKNKPTDPSKD